MSERFTVHLDELEFASAYPHEASFHSRNVINQAERCMVANGCFDILHPGHLNLFAFLDTLAYREGLRPIIAMNSDASVRRLKGDRRPIVPQESRSFLLNHLKWPMTVVIFEEDTPQRLMDLLKPRIVVKGAEYPEDMVVRWRDSRVVTVPMVPRWSTSKIVGDTR